jgi:hypothetical protein
MQSITPRGKFAGTAQPRQLTFDPPYTADESAVPFKSQAQRRKFAQLLVDGKVSAATFEEWNRETGAKAPSRARRSQTQNDEGSTLRKR